MGIFGKKKKKKGAADDDEYAREDAYKDDEYQEGLEAEAEEGDDSDIEAEENEKYNRRPRPADGPVERSTEGSFLSRQPCAAALEAPTSHQMSHDAQEKPDHALQLDFVYGYRAHDSRHNLVYNVDGLIVYPAVRVARDVLSAHVVSRPRRRPSRLLPRRSLLKKRAPGKKTTHDPNLLRSSRPPPHAGRDRDRVRQRGAHAAVLHDAHGRHRVPRDAPGARDHRDRTGGQGAYDLRVVGFFFALPSL